MQQRIHIERQKRLPELLSLMQKFDGKGGEYK